MWKVYIFFLATLIAFFKTDDILVFAESNSALLTYNEDKFTLSNLDVYLSIAISPFIETSLKIFLAKGSIES